MKVGKSASFLLTQPSILQATNIARGIGRCSLMFSDVHLPGNLTVKSSSFYATWNAENVFFSQKRDALWCFDEFEYMFCYSENWRFQIDISKCVEILPEDTPTTTTQPEDRKVKVATRGNPGVSLTASRFA